MLRKTLLCAAIGQVFGSNSTDETTTTEAAAPAAGSHDVQLTLSTSVTSSAIDTCAESVQYANVVLYANLAATANKLHGIGSFDKATVKFCGTDGTPTSPDKFCIGRSTPSVSGLHTSMAATYDTTSKAYKTGSSCGVTRRLEEAEERELNTAVTITDVVNVAYTSDAANTDLAASTTNDAIDGVTGSDVTTQIAAIKTELAALTGTNDGSGTFSAAIPGLQGAGMTFAQIAGGDGTNNITFAVGTAVSAISANDTTVAATPTSSGGGGSTSGAAGIVVSGLALAGAALFL